MSMEKRNLQKIAIQISITAENVTHKGEEKQIDNLKLYHNILSEYFFNVQCICANYRFNDSTKHFLWNCRNMACYYYLKSCGADRFSL